MALSRQQKEEQVKELAAHMKKSSSVIFTHYLGLTVADITKLRSNLKKENALMQVAKKTLIRLAAKEASAPEVNEDLLPGDIACIFSLGEPNAGPASAIAFAKDHPHIKLVGGIFSGKLLNEQEANEFARIPNKLTLLGIFMSMCNAPLTQFASAIGSPLTGFARALSEVAKKKASEVPAAAPVAASAAPEAPKENPPAAAAPSLPA
jgi:large subunit ribosomal protein L10